MIKKIINSGNTGTEAAALGVAWQSGIQTGGHIPKGYKTSTGFNPSLKLFGLTEADEEAKQSTCIKMNIENSDGTLLFIKDVSDFGKAEEFTKDYCRTMMKPVMVIQMKKLLDFEKIDVFINDKKIKTLHVTGRIDSKDNKTVYNIVYRYMSNYIKNGVVLKKP